jgi:hypothetical protein
MSREISPPTLFPFFVALRTYSASAIAPLVFAIAEIPKRPSRFKATPLTDQPTLAGPNEFRFQARWALSSARAGRRSNRRAQWKKQIIQLSTANKMVLCGEETFDISICLLASTCNLAREGPSFLCM